MKIAVVSALALACAAGVANASLQFSFADPQPGRQMTNTAGALAYDQSAVLMFHANLSDAGLSANQTWSNARMEMNMSVGIAVLVAPGLYQAPVSGFFEVYDMSSSSRVAILRGTASAGAYVRYSGTNSMLFSDPDLQYSAGPAMNSLLPSGQSFSFDNPQEAVFTLTDMIVAGGGSVIGQNGLVRNFDANASYSGNSGFTIVPTPGAAALLGIGGLMVGRRRR